MRAPSPAFSRRNRPFARRVLQLGYRYRSSTKMVAPKASNASSKSAKWCPHQRSEPPGNFAVSTTARAGQRSHRSAAVRVQADLLSSEVFISATPPRLYGDLYDTTCVTVHRDQRPPRTGPCTHLKRDPAATKTSSRFAGTKHSHRGDPPGRGCPLMASTALLQLTNAVAFSAAERLLKHSALRRRQCRGTAGAHPGTAAMPSHSPAAITGTLPGAPPALSRPPQLRIGDRSPIVIRDLSRCVCG